MNGSAYLAAVIKKNFNNFIVEKAIGNQ